MARISDIEPTKHDDCIIMAFIGAQKANDYYKENAIGFEVNDGKYIKFIENKEATNDSNL